MNTEKESSTPREDEKREDALDYADWRKLLGGNLEEDVRQELQRRRKAGGDEKESSGNSEDETTHKASLEHFSEALANLERVTREVGALLDRGEQVDQTLGAQLKTAASQVALERLLDSPRRELLQRLFEGVAAAAYEATGEGYNGEHGDPTADFVADYRWWVKLARGLLKSVREDPRRSTELLE